MATFTVETRYLAWVHEIKEVQAGSADDIDNDTYTSEVVVDRWEDIVQTDYRTVTPKD